MQEGAEKKICKCGCGAEVSAGKKKNKVYARAQCGIRDRVKRHRAKKSAKQDSGLQSGGY